MLEVASDDLYQRDPHAILETFLVYQQTVGPKGLSARTLRALYNARDLMDAKFRRDPVNRAHLHEDPAGSRAGQTHAFRLMNQTSVLGRYLWVFRRIVGQMQHDLFHVYTVDQHILMVLRNVRRFFIPEHAHEYPFCSQLASQFDRPWVLYIAALFHDVAKGRGGDHSELGGARRGASAATTASTREDAALIEFLVGAHLTMSRIAQKEDLSDPDVIEAFAKLVGNERRLTALYLLTVADIRGTSPKVWNAWKGKLLEDLYRLTLRALGGARPNLDAEIEARKHEARQLLNLRSLLPGTRGAAVEARSSSATSRATTPATSPGTRARCGATSTTPEPVVRARLSPLGEGLQVLVYAPDRPDLFARICGYFDSAGFNILDAKVHTTRSRLRARHLPGRQPARSSTHYRDLISLVETQLALALTATGPLPEPSRGRISRRVRSFPVTPRVTLRPDERAQRWLLGVSASDRSGLLYAIARVLASHHINLQLAKITTLGERVEDTFLIDGPALQQNKMQLQIETELLDAISAVSRRPRRSPLTPAMPHAPIAAADALQRLGALRRRHRRALARASSPTTTCPARSTGRRSNDAERALDRHRVQAGLAVRRRASAARRWSRATSPRTSSARCSTSRATGSRSSTAGAAASAAARSALVLGQIGFRVHVLEGGYQAFRARRASPTLDDAAARASTAASSAARTGSRQEPAAARAAPQRGAQVLDLEALANHRGSVLGLVPGEPQPSQKAFDTAVWDALRRFDPARPVFVESESKKVGDLRVPPSADRAHARRAVPAGSSCRCDARVALLLAEYDFFVARRRRLLRAASTRCACCAATRSSTAGRRPRAPAGSPRSCATCWSTHYDPIYLQSMRRNFAGTTAPLAAIVWDGERLRRPAGGRRRRRAPAALTPCAGRRCTEKSAPVAKPDSSDASHAHDRGDLLRLAQALDRDASATILSSTSWRIALTMSVPM